MAQLSDDDLAFGGKLATLADIRAALRDQVRIVAETEEIDVLAADGRVLAHDVIAPLSIPSFDNSAVDGYAVRIADVAAQGRTLLAVVDRVTAGGTAARMLRAGEAARIFTGAPLPPGADTVFMQEDVTADGDRVEVPAGLERGANARFVGEDIRQGEVALAGGLRLKPQHVALAAALGLSHLKVRKQLRLAVFSTGDEVAAAGGALAGAELYDANRPMLMALARQAGCEVIDGGIIPDAPEKLAAALSDAAMACDIIVTSGGVSTGEEDHVKAVITRIGRLDWWRIGIKPGRPVAAGVIRGAAFVGLPGNPVAAYVTFRYVVRPLVAALGGEAWHEARPQAVRAGFAYRKREGRREYVRVSLDKDWPLPLASKHRQDGAGVITSLTASEGLIELHEQMTKVEPGDILPFYAFSALDD